MTRAILKHGRTAGTPFSRAGKIGILIVAIAFASAASLSALDFGLELGNKAGIQNSGTFDWFTDHKETGWLTIPFDASGDNSLAIEGSFYASKPVNKTDFRYYADLDLFRLSFVPVSGDGFRLGIDIGRIPVSDITGLIFNQPLDGAEFHAAFPFGNIEFTAGYTGLMNVRRSTGTFMSSDDYADANTEAVYAFGASRLFGKITVQLPQLFGGIDLIVEGAGQFDMRRFTRASYSEIIDTAYGTLYLSLPVSKFLFCSLMGTYQTGVLTASGQPWGENSLMAQARIDIYPVAGNQLYAQIFFSAAPGDFFSYFLPVTFQSAGTLYTAGYGNLMKASAGWYCNPLHFLNIDISGNLFLDTKNAMTGANVYNATELTAGATIRAASDLKFRLDSAFLFPNAAEFQYQASLKAIFEL